MRTRRTATAHNTAGIDPHTLVASAFLRHYEETEIPEGFLKSISKNIARDTGTPENPSNTLITSYQIEQKLKKRHDQLDPQFLSHIIHTTIGWKHSSTVLDATTRTNVTPDNTNWLDKRIAQRLPPGTTYVAYNHRIHRYNYNGFFVTPDMNSKGIPSLLTIHVGKYPIGFNIPLDKPEEETITKLLNPYKNTWPHLNNRDRSTLTSIIGIIKTLTGALGAHHEINGLDIQTRAENITNLITHVLASHQQLHKRLNQLREQTPASRPILTPTSLINRVLKNPDDPKEAATVHLIAAVHALNNGGQIIINEKPLSEIPGQLTTMHTLPPELVTQAEAPAIYLCANVTRANTLNGVIIRPDVDAHGHPQLVLTFHSAGFPSVIIPLGIQVWEATKLVEQQLEYQNKQGLPDTSQELTRYVIAIFTALYRILTPNARLPRNPQQAALDPNSWTLS